METQVNTMTIREQAKAAYDQDEQERIERARLEVERQEEQAGLWLKELLGNIGIHVEPTSRSITLDGITFRAVYHTYDWELEMLMPYPCWECQKDVWEHINDLPDVHRKLVDAGENPVECDKCRKKHERRTDFPAPPTPLERLGQAMADYLEYLEQEAR